MSTTPTNPETARSTNEAIKLMDSDEVSGTVVNLRFIAKQIRLGAGRQPGSPFARTAAMNLDLLADRFEEVSKRA